MISTNPRAIGTRRHQGPRFTASVSDWLVGSHRTWFRDHVTGNLDGDLTEKLPIIYPTTGSRIRSVGRLAIYRPGHGRFTLDRYTAWATKDGVRSLRTRGPRGRIHVNTLSRFWRGDTDRLVVRHFRNDRWHVTTVAGEDDITTALDWLMERPEEAALTHLTAIRKSGLIVKVGSDALRAYTILGLLEPHPLDLMLGLRDHYGRYALRQRRLNVETNGRAYPS